MEQVIAIRYLPPGNRAKLREKSLFMPENIFPGANLYPICISMVLKRNKKSLYAQFFETSHFKNNCSNLPSESILLKFCQNVSNR